MSERGKLPEICIVKHARAKRLRLTVSAQGVRLTVPSQTSKNQIDAFLAQSQAWLQSTWQSQQHRIAQAKQQAFPEQLQLSYTNQSITLQIKEQDKLFIFDKQQQRLFLNQSYPEYALTQFVLQQAQQVLPAQLLNYAQQNQLRVNKVRLATPKTRWGSCNQRQEIMLHSGLLLMPQHYVDYVLYHELAHTVHLHHQAAFWQFLERMYPQARKIQQQVRQFHLPSWWQVKR